MKRGRPRHNDILTPREWEVAALMQRGLTNEQIAERLGISFGGAKYHVAEIMSKLGVASRDEVGGYLEARRPATPMRGLLALLPAFWRRGDGSPAAVPLALAAGVIASIVFGFLVVLPGFNDATHSRTGTEEQTGGGDFGLDLAGELAGITKGLPLGSYFLEGTMQSTGQDPSILPREQMTAVRAWFNGPESWRWELLSASGEPALRWTYNGASYHQYRGETNTYSESSLPTELQGEGGPVFSLMIGPITPRRAEILLAPAQPWVVAGAESVAGREATIVDIAMTDGGMRLWIDAEYAFILKVELTSSIHHQTFELTRVEYNQPVSASDLAVTLSPDAVEVDPDPPVVPDFGSLGPAGGSHAVSPPGFLNLAYVPAGYVVSGTAAHTDAGNNIYAYAVSYRSQADSSRTFVVRQQWRAGGITSAQRTGAPVAIGPETGYAQEAAGEWQVVFGRGDIIVTVVSSSLDFDEMLRVATGMQ